MKKPSKAVKLDKTPRVLAANDLQQVTGAVQLNPLYMGADTSGDNPLYAAMNNPIYKPSGTSGYNPLHAV